MIRLIDARLCDDCSSIFDEELSTRCPRCASNQSIRIDRFLKPIEPTIAQYAEAILGNGGRADDSDPGDLAS